jgi:CRISPR-associated endonuclease/helicase Cas3
MAEYEEFYAHSKEGTPPAQWQKLEKHLVGTAEKVAVMASEFASAGWGYLAGLWHDLGKYSPEFQRYIRETGDPDAHIEHKSGNVDHSTCGALHAIDHFGMIGRVLAYLLAGHHAGLPDYEGDITVKAALSQRLKRVELLESIKGNTPLDILNRQLPKDRPARGADPSLWVRLLFSCLVDADFLDTEAFLEPDKAASRAGYPVLPELLATFSAHMEKKQLEAPKTDVNQIRAKIFARCTAKAFEPPGIYTLTVPTGGGKTLSSMAFALTHAVRYGKRRIIYVIP